MKITKKQLEMLLDSIPEHPNPRIELEQYTIPGALAATMLWIAEFKYHDIYGRVVIDLGCGTGRLAIGAAILGANCTVGIDIDPIALSVAKTNAYRLGVDKTTNWLCSDVLHVDMRGDVVIQNPPFGVQKTMRHMDTLFLMKSLEIARKAVYTLHKSGPKTRSLLEKLIKEVGGRITEVITLKFDIKPIYRKHRKRHYLVDVDMYRISLEG